MPTYTATAAQFERIEKSPRISGKFAIEKNLWDGRRVAVHYLRERGDRRRRTNMQIAYGTLVLRPTGRPDQIGVRDTDGNVHVIHATRAKDIYDFGRTRRPA